jgi:hypothetical protein
METDRNKTEGKEEADKIRSFKMQSVLRSLYQGQCRCPAG